MKRRLIFNAPALKPRRKQLRNRATETEKILWTCLNKGKLGHKFIRQYSVEGYVIDFYCPETKIGVELDGNYHKNKSQLKYDGYRTKWLMAYGIKLIRFWNWEVKTQLTQVLKRIKNFPS